MIDTAEMECYLVGCICQKQETVRVISKYVREEDFRITACGLVFSAALDADGRGKLFDAYCAADVLNGKIENPRKFIAECIETVPTTTNAEEYAIRVRVEADERYLREKVTEALEVEHGVKLTETVAAICSEIVQNRPNNRMKPIGSVMKQMYGALFEQPTNRIDTGYGRLDFLLKGLWGGELVVIGARPAVGKSAFALSIAENAARRTGKTVQFYSLEMEDVEIAERALARHTQTVTMDNLIDRSLNDSQGDETAEAFTSVAALPIVIDDSANMKPSKVRAQALTQENLGMIVVDYGGLMSADRKYDSRNLELGAISRDLKNLAKELHVPVVMLAQLNRGVGDDMKPSLRELRDSGELEQNANKCIFLWNIDRESGKVGVSVAKNRRGRLGEVVMYFDGGHMRFTETEERYEEIKRPKRRGRSSVYEDDDEDEP